MCVQNMHFLAFAQMLEVFVNEVKITALALIESNFKSEYCFYSKHNLCPL